AVVIGRDDDVPTDPIALRQRPLDLREELAVVVDVLVVVHLDPGLLRELVQGRMLLALHVDVERPVREVQDVVHLATARASTASTAGGEKRREREQRATGCAAPQELLSGQPWVHASSSSVSRPVRSTTNVDSGAQLRTTLVPGAGTRPPASMFCANTWTVPAA